MQVSERGLDLIREFEGLRLEAYRDSVGVWTIGYGHTVGVKEGDTCSPEDAAEWLRQDVKRAEACLNANVTAELLQNEFDALASFVYNIGCGKFRASSVLAKLNAGDYDGAMAVLKKYTRAGGQVLAGLERRRAAEAELFERA